MPSDPACLLPSPSCVYDTLVVATVEAGSRGGQCALVSVDATGGRDEGG